ncbi:MAG: glycosyltransferase family 4 protein [Candidatus Jordarchaeaceae archaeon]
MKIAYIYDMVYPWIKGGVEKRIYEVGKRLAKRGHEIHWFGLNWWPSDEDAELEGIHLHGIGKWDNLYVDGRRSINEAVYFGVKSLVELNGDFDIVDCQEFPYFPFISAKVRSLFKKFHVVLTWHEVWRDYWFEYLGRKGIFGYIVEKMVAKLSERNVAVSKRAKEDLERIIRKWIKIIPNGVDFKRIEKIKPSQEKSDVVFAGRLIKAKNIDVLIKAISLLRKDFPDIKCLVIGDGPEKSKLEKLAINLGLVENVKFASFLENYDDVISHFKSSKVFVLPSSREGFGIVALEANACGLPVMTVNHKMNAVCEFVRNGENGFICRLSAKDIADKILAAFDFQSKNKCIETAKKYDWNYITDLAETYYEEIV